MNMQYVMQALISNALATGATVSRSSLYIYIDRYVQYIVNAVSFSRRIYQLAAIETISLQSVLHKVL